MRLLRKIIFLVLFISLFSHQQATSQTVLKGEGSSLIYPLFSKWMIDFSGTSPGFEIDYKPNSSATGIRQLINSDVDFIFTESFTTDEEEAKSGGVIKHFPVSVAGIGVIVNLPGNSSILKLTPQILAEIYMGKITTWDNQKIIQLNPSLKVAAKFPIVVTYRSDSSGTNEAFSDFLSKSDSSWNAQVGKSRLPKWPLGIGAGGSQALIGVVRQNPGAIAYVGGAYLKINDLAEVAIQNAAGDFVLPRPEAVEMAAKTAAREMPANFKQSLVALKGKGVYPIAVYTYVAVRTKGNDKKLKLSGKWIKWLLGSGQKLNNSLDHAPLPNEILKKVKASVAENLP